MAGTGQPGLMDAVRATRLTPGGQWFVQGAFTLGVVAYAAGYGPAYAAFALLASLCVVGWLGAVLAGRALEAEASGPDRVFAGEEFNVRVEVRSRLPLEVGPVTVLRVAPRRGEGATRAAVLGRVPARATGAAEVRTLLRRRGVHRPGGLVATTSWPFGIAEASIPVRGAAEILAYPRRVPVPPRVLRAPAVAAARARSGPAPPRGGERLRGLREYVPGDPARAVAWRASARHGRMLSREFEREAPSGAVVLLDADARDLPAPDRRTAVERACSLAASLVLRLRAEGRPVAFGAWTPEPAWIPRAGSRAGAAAALEAMARLVPPAAGAPRRDPLDLLPPGRGAGAEVIVVAARGGGERSTRGRRGLRAVCVGAMRAAFVSPERGGAANGGADDGRPAP